LIGKPEGKRYLEGVDGRVLLKWILKNEWEDTD
jgi:hypothetical protein